MRRLPVLGTRVARSLISKIRMGASKSISKRARSSDSENGQIRCVCGVAEEVEDDGETWIACDGCDCRQHSICMGISVTDGKLPKQYKCEKCDPDSHKPLLEAFDRGLKLWKDRRESEEKQKSDKEKSEEIPKRRSKKARKRLNRQNATNDDNMDDADESALYDSTPASFDLTDECHHYTSISEVPWDIQK